jgi:hypothetical protein
MQITRVFKQQEDGSYIFEMKLSEEQVGFLVNFAVGELVQAGIANYIDLDEEGNEFDTEQLNQESDQKQEKKVLN